MKVTEYLVTGGTGLIGKAFITRLLLAKPQVNVTVISRQADAKKQFLEISDIEPHRDNIHIISNIDQLSSAYQCDCFINLAGHPIAQGRWTKTVRNKIRGSRVDLTRDIFDYFDSSGHFPSTVISASAIGYYGNKSDSKDINRNENNSYCIDSEPKSELMAPGNNFSAHLCKDWENEADKFVTRGSRVCKLRLGVVLAKQGGMLKKLIPAYKLGFGGALGAGQQWLPWIHIDDVLNFIEYCIENNNTTGAYNLVAPHNVKQIEFAKTLAHAINRPAFLKTPAIMLKILFGQMAEELLLSGQKILPKRTQQSGFIFNYGLLSDAIESLVS